MRAISFEGKIDQADSRDWMSFLPSNLLEEIITNSETSAQKLKVFCQHGIIERSKMV